MNLLQSPEYHSALTQLNKLRAMRQKIQAQKNEKKAHAFHQKALYQRISDILEEIDEKQVQPKLKTPRTQESKTSQIAHHSVPPMIEETLLDEAQMQQEQMDLHHEMLALEREHNVGVETQEEAALGQLKSRTASHIELNQELSAKQDDTSIRTFSNLLVKTASVMSAKCHQAWQNAQADPSSLPIYAWSACTDTVCGIACSIIGIPKVAQDLGIYIIKSLLRRAWRWIVDHTSPVTWVALGAMGSFGANYLMANNPVLILAANVSICIVCGYFGLSKKPPVHEITLVNTAH